MKIIADDKIPYVAHFFTQCDNIQYLPGEMITRATLCNADILLTRTVTHVNESLLKNTSVRFVGTATTGTDHIDTHWLDENDITLATAAGANAQAVAEYVTDCLDALKRKNLLYDKKTAGIIGCGRIGQRVAHILQTMGLDVICYDPLLTEKPQFHFVSLEELIDTADLISIHTPLTKTGSYPTHHLLNKSRIDKIKSNAIIINTARGGVIDQAALLQKKEVTLCLDVWEHEPHISLELLRKVFIGTPHIAGYSVQAKYRATEMIYEAAATFFGWEKNNIENFLLEKNTLASHYDPLAHTMQFRTAFQECKTNEEVEKIFIAQRKKYPLRHR